MIDSFGARLRRERERREISLKSIAESTKISLALLDGLERDDLSRWPSGIFRRAFVRSYAQALGLDPKPILHEFEEHHPDPLQVAALAQETTAAPPAPKSPKVFPIWGALRGRTRVHPLADVRPLVVKLTITAGSPFTGGKLLANIRRRCAAAAYDAGVSCAIALGLFPALGHFWTPLGISMLCYYFVSILILGNTPGVCLFASQSADSGGARIADRRERETPLRMRA